MIRVIRPEYALDDGRQQAHEQLRRPVPAKVLAQQWEVTGHRVCGERADLVGRPPASRRPATAGSSAWLRDHCSRSGCAGGGTLELGVAPGASRLSASSTRPSSSWLKQLMRDVVALKYSARGRAGFVAGCDDDDDLAGAGPRPTR